MGGERYTTERRSAPDKCAEGADVLYPFRENVQRRKLGTSHDTKGQADLG